MSKTLTRRLTTPVALGLLVLALIVASRAGAQNAGVSILRNGNFENGTGGWNASTAIFSVASPGHSGDGAYLSNPNATDRAQLFQNSLPLQPAANYEIVFWGRSDAGTGVTVSLVQGVSPFTNYGLQQMFVLTPEWQEYRMAFATTGFASPVTDGRLRFRLNAGAGGAVVIDDVALALSAGGPTNTATATSEATMTATATSTAAATSTATATNTVVAPTNTATSTATTVAASTNTPTSTATVRPSRTPTSTPTVRPSRTPTSTPTQRPTNTPTATRTPSRTPTATATLGPATNTPTATATRLATNTPTATATTGPSPTATGTFTPQGDEKLIFDWNGVAAQSLGGFVQFRPLSKYPQFDNGDWVTGNFQYGTIYVRVLVRGMPTAEGQPGMKLGFCFWQQTPLWGEECQNPHTNVPGLPGTERRFTLLLDEFAVINRAPINWAYPRWKAGFVVRNSKGKPVSNKLDFNWSGENPAHWYPMDIRYTMVLVAPGGDGFSGWQNYGWSTP